MTLTLNEANVLFTRLCEDLGFCNAPFGMVLAPPDTPEDFLTAVIVAEGLDPETMDRHVYRLVRDAVYKAFRDAEYARLFEDYINKD